MEHLPAINSDQCEIINDYPIEAITAETLDIPDVHGWLARSRGWSHPVKVTHCESEARPGYSSLPAHEYNDVPAVLGEKVKVLVQLLKSSEQCLLYTGAGISTASGIGDYATQVEKGDRPRLRSPMEAQPTYAHIALKEQYDKNIVKYWVQQNHDGLPQKAGFPQAALNEIHGAWYDPSNPVVMMSGALRSDLFDDLLEWEQRTDLTLALGTSMCGMNSDRVFTTVAKKAIMQRGNALGGVIVGLQRTQHDDLAALKIYAPVDVVMREVMRLLGVAECVCYPPLRNYQPDVPSHATIGLPSSHMFRVPYSSSGHRVESDSLGVMDCTNFIVLDLREGARVRLTAGPYAGDEGEVIGNNLEGHYRIVFNHKLNPSKELRRPFERVLGSWWVTAAVAGSVPQIPVVNIVE